MDDLDDGRVPVRRNGQGRLWSLIGYGVHFQTLDGERCEVGLFLGRPAKSLLQMIGRCEQSEH